MGASGRVAAGALLFPLQPPPPLLLLLLPPLLLFASCAAAQVPPCVCANATLDCSGRQLAVLPDADFCDEEVTKVNLQRNNFTSFPANLNASVVEVQVASNHLTRLPAPSFLSAELRALDVSRNRIEGGAGDELQPLWALRVLRVKGNLLTALRFLPAPCALRELDASANALVALDDALLNCDQLETLDLSRNDLGPLPDAVFQNMTELRYLDLSLNKRLGPLSNLTFDGLYQLRNLTLQWVELKEIAEGVFDPLAELEHLDLRRNSLASIPDAAFAWNPNLRVLNLYTNHFTFVPEAIRNVTSLEVLDLSNNRIEEVSDDFLSNFPRLRELTLNGNKITTIPVDAFVGLWELQKLDLSFNRGLELPSGVFSGLVNLEVLRLAHCGLPVLPFDEFRELTNLTKLELSGNRVTRFPERALQTLTRLQHLNLCNSPLGALPETAFQGLEALESLRLCDAGLGALPSGLLAGLRRLSWLHLGVNNLTTLPRTLFRDTPQLSILELFRNQLSHIPDGVFSGLQQLRYLFLSNNRLTQLPVLRGCCAALRDATFYANRVAQPSEAALRALLERGGGAALQHRLVVHLYDNPVAPAALRWLLREPGVEMRLSDNCRCGKVRRGQAFVNLCVDVRCGADAAASDWVHAVRLADAA